MNVLQCPIEIAGQMGMLSKALATIGVSSTAYNMFHTYLGYREHVHNIDAYELELMMHDLIAHFDVFHFHYGQSIAPGLADLPEIKKRGKPMIMHHWGNDVRTHELATQHNPFAYTGDSPPPGQIHETLRRITQHIDHCIVQDYEVYPYVAPYYKHVHILPIAFDVQAVTPIFPSLSETHPLVLHAPTNPLFKGTEYVEAAVEQLQAEGYLFRYQRIEKMSNSEALHYYKAADVVVDQILCGSYGMLAVESMALGKPVIGYVREDLKPLYPDVPPIVSANPTQVYEALKSLITNPLLRQETGVKGRAFAQAYHDIRVIAPKLLEIYQSIRPS